MTRMMQERGVQMQAEQLPISAIVRCPLLAIRWQLPNKKVITTDVHVRDFLTVQIRRIQVRFKSNADFDTVYHQLHQLGLRMSGSTPAQEQSSSRSPSLLCASSSRPSLTAVAYPEQLTRGPAIGGPSCPPSRLAEISNRPYTATNAPTSLESQLQEAAHTRPASAATGYARDERSTSTAFTGALAPPVYFARPTSSTSEVLDRTSYDISFSSQDHHMPTIEEVPRQSSERPETAMLFNRPATAETLPPRRELPFPRLSADPLSSGNDGTRPSSRPSTGLMGPPPLPARVADLRPSSSRGASKELELPPLPQPTVVSKTALGKQAMQQPPRTPNQDQNTPLRSRTSPMEGIENHSPLSSSPASASSPLSFRRSSSNALSAPRPLSELSNAAQNLRRTMDPNTPPASDAIFQGSSASGGIPNTGTTNEHDGLAAYAMQSDEGRRAALNEFIFRHLESDDFLTLVEDLETAWARTALGMH
jgi:hypothetical protein